MAEGGAEEGEAFPGGEAGEEPGLRGEHEECLRGKTHIRQSNPNTAYNRQSGPDSGPGRGVIVRESFQVVPASLESHAPDENHRERESRLNF